MSKRPILPDVERRLHRALLEALLVTGTVPSVEALARTVGIAHDELPGRLDALVLSVVPTPYGGWSKARAEPSVV